MEALDLEPPADTRAVLTVPSALARVAERSRPVALAGQQALPVLPCLLALLPDGLRRGTTVSIEPGPGATALAMVLVAGASAGGSWVAAVGVPSLGLAATAELGVAPERLLVVDVGPGSQAGTGPGATPVGPGRTGRVVAPATVVAALIDAVDIVVLGSRVGSSDARRLAARAREQGAVVVALPGRWPGVADLRLRVDGGTWELPHRVLAARRVAVTAEGRGAAARARRAALWLPGPDGSPAPVAGADTGDEVVEVGDRVIAGAPA